MFIAVDFRFQRQTMVPKLDNFSCFNLLFHFHHFTSSNNT